MAGAAGAVQGPVLGPEQVSGHGPLGQWSSVGWGSDSSPGGTLGVAWRRVWFSQLGEQHLRVEAAGAGSWHPAVQGGPTAGAHEVLGLSGAQVEKPGDSRGRICGAKGQPWTHMGVLLQKCERGGWSGPWLPGRTPEPEVCLVQPGIQVPPTKAAVVSWKRFELGSQRKHFLRQQGHNPCWLHSCPRGPPETWMGGGGWPTGALWAGAWLGDS